MTASGALSMAGSKSERFHEGVLCAVSDVIDAAVPDKENEHNRLDAGRLPLPSMVRTPRADTSSARG